MDQTVYIGTAAMRELFVFVSECSENMAGLTRAHPLTVQQNVRAQAKIVLSACF
jgi:hypothetical protein